MEDGHRVGMGVAGRPRSPGRSGCGPGPRVRGGRGCGLGCWVERLVVEGDAYAPGERCDEDLGRRLVTTCGVAVDPEVEPKVLQQVIDDPHAAHAILRLAR